MSGCLFKIILYHLLQNCLHFYKNKNNVHVTQNIKHNVILFIEGRREIKFSVEKTDKLTTM